MPAIVVDAGGTYLRCGIAVDGGTVTRIARERIPNFLTAARIWEPIIEMVGSYADSVERDVDTGTNIVFSVPGPVSRSSRLIHAPTLIGDNRDDIPDIAALLAERTKRSVHLINDVSAAAWHVSERIADDRFFVVTVSSGIGGKFFDRQHPERVFDSQPFAGEIGHIAVDFSAGAPMCDCGVPGHLGAISSGRGTERFARRAAAAKDGGYRTSILSREYNVEPDDLNNHDHLVPAALGGDVWARAIIAAAAEPLARVLSAIVVAAGIQRIVIMGGFAQQLGAVYRDALTSRLSQCLNSPAIRVDVHRCVAVLDAGEEASLSGAAAFFRRGLGR